MNKLGTTSEHIALELDNAFRKFIALHDVTVPASAASLEQGHEEYRQYGNQFRDAGSEDYQARIDAGKTTVMGPLPAEKATLLKMELEKAGIRTAQTNYPLAHDRGDTQVAFLDLELNATDEDMLKVLAFRDGFREQINKQAVLRITQALQDVDISDKPNVLATVISEQRGATIDNVTQCYRKIRAVN